MAYSAARFNHEAKQINGVVGLTKMLTDLDPLLKGEKYPHSPPKLRREEW